MVPVEPVSLSIGIAALFKSCIECFEYFKAAPTLRKDFDLLLLKLDLEKERLLVWGETVGIGTQDCKEELVFNGDNKRQELAQRCLNAIKTLLDDAESLRSLYGVQLITTPTRTVCPPSISSNAFKRFRVRSARSSNEVGVLKKTRWAIHHAASFEKLVGHLRDLIDGLMRDAPGTPGSHEQKVQDDIASMADDIASLRLLSEACEDIYPNWSNTAKSAIDASEMGTIDGGLEIDRIERYQADNDSTSAGTHRRTSSFGPDKSMSKTG